MSYICIFFIINKSINNLCKLTFRTFDYMYDRQELMSLLYMCDKPELMSLLYMYDRQELMSLSTCMIDKN